MFVSYFKILGAVVSEKSLTQISQCITLEWETEKKQQNKYTIYLTLCRCMQNLKTGSNRSWEICDENFIGEKEKMDK